MFQRIQVGFHRSVVDAQELVGRSHHVDTVGFAFRAFLVHELVDRLVKGTGFATAIAALDLPPPACYVIAKAA